MANFQASAQYDVFNIIPLQDPLTRIEIPGGFRMTDPAGDFVNALGDLTLDAQNDFVGTLHSVAHYFSNDMAYYSFLNLNADASTGGNYYENGYTIDGRTLYAESAETAYWLSGSDVLNGSIYSDVLSGFEGNDVISGGAGADTLYGSNGDDYIDGGTENDALLGGVGNDTLLGGIAADQLFGGQGDDQLLGGKGWDDLQGGVGNDLLRGAMGCDTLTGGAGQDAFRFETALDPVWNVDTITDFVSGVDRIELSASIFTAFAEQVGQQIGLNQYLQYDQTSGVLSYDADGFGAATAIPVAILGVASHPAVGVDFLIV